MKLLAVDTATDVLSLAVGDGARVLERSLAAGRRHAELVLGEIDALLAAAGVQLRALDGLVYGAGPGSFTGLRIACGVVQGLAAARALPVLGVSTLASMAEALGAPRVIACLDARMGEVYHAAFERRTGVLHEAIPPGLARPGAVPLPEGTGWTGCGGGFAAHGAALAARLGAALVATVPDTVPSAAAMVRIAAPRFARGEGEDPAAVSPLYVRDRVALKTSER